ncbi:pentapeptide repeat-containing protein [Roseovarius sp.]|uniref:pentapeptide repeat-containing protein n=1 Tax=Roseovarius sp. TaxID=1486281 RepID=UPI003D0BB57D
MNSLVEDWLTDEDRRSIAAVLASKALRFDRLIEISGLDPKEDFKHSNLRRLNFCGADLRGFDFTGSDLRGSAVDERTIIDDTTILEGAEIDWVTERDIQIVQLMQEVQTASTSQQRRKALETLEKKFGKTDHVISFVVNAAAEVTTIDAYLDFADFLPSGLQGQHLTKLCDAGVRAVTKKMSKSRARTGRATTTIFAVSAIVDRLAVAEGSFASDWFKSLAEIIDADTMNDKLSGTSVNINQRQIVAALDALYVKKALSSNSRKA